MALEGTGKSEFTKLVTYHVLGNIYRNVLSAIVNCDGVTDKLREYRRGTRPGLENLLLILFVHSYDTVEELLFNVGCFL